MLLEIRQSRKFIQLRISPIIVGDRLEQETNLCMYACEKGVGVWVNSNKDLYQMLQSESWCFLYWSHCLLDLKFNSLWADFFFFFLQFICYIVLLYFGDDGWYDRGNKSKVDYRELWYWCTFNSFCK